MASETLAFRAHARLLTMLGEQLIKNERVALVEIVKNAYDADADRVTIDFQRFAADFTPLPGASIVITDDGVGMTETLVRTAWMNPATPSKALRKQNEPATTKKRVLQGEKGIGRFATFKLGSEVTVVTRARGQEQEVTLFVDISALDEQPDQARRNLDPDFYLEQIPALMEIGPPRLFADSGTFGSLHGTQISISSLRAAWSERLVRGAFNDLARLQPLMWSGEDDTNLRPDFEVTFLKDGSPLPYREEQGEEFEAALDRAVMMLRNGRFDDTERQVTFDLNGRPIVIDIDDAEIRGLKPFKDRFLKDANGRDLPAETIPVPTCGPFGFEFYVFDLSPSAPARYELDKEQAKLVKAHRIYLYRDGIRVYPYGDADDDWLEIDASRGTEAAGRTLSNDQTVGYVTITQADNPNLKDKTSREGLIESGTAVDDFKAVIKTVLRYARKRYQPYLDSKERARTRESQASRIDRHVANIRKQAGLSEEALKQLDALELALAAERELFEQRLARTEQLAGVGLSVETASHDLILAGSEALRTARHVALEIEILDLRNETVYALAKQLVARLDFINSRFRDVQGLFVSTRRKQTEQNIMGIARRVRSIYARLHKEKEIEFEIDSKATLRAPSTEAAVLQLLINLVDNATYWLLASPHQPRIIRIFNLDSATLVVTDSGPGVKEEDAPYIFEPFYSGKGEDGKGLGLYIARQNGLRNGFTVELGRSGDDRDLPGATFIVRFGETRGEDVNP